MTTLVVLNIWIKLLISTRLRLVALQDRIQLHIQKFLMLFELFFQKPPKLKYAGISQVDLALMLKAADVRLVKGMAQLG